MNWALHHSSEYRRVYPKITTLVDNLKTLFPAPVSRIELVKQECRQDVDSLLSCGKRNFYRAPCSRTCLLISEQISTCELRIMFTNPSKFLSPNFNLSLAMLVPSTPLYALHRLRPVLFGLWLK